ncbi:MAG: hypothetical protein ABSA10_08600 [Anaerolineales bacterium]|jgi:hypothetical protein
MPTNPLSFPIDRPATYRITLLGRLDAGWEEWFDGMSIAVSKGADGRTVTTLTGVVPDQAALHGLLTRVRDLSIPLLRVRRMAPDANPSKNP